MKRRIGGRKFQRVGAIKLETAAMGRPRTYRPQARYNNVRRLSLHKYGALEYCRFSIAGGDHREGVYALTVGRRVVYVGECSDLAQRFGSRGYGAISPRNCYEGGQSTNCKINHLILRSTRVRKKVVLWFFPTKRRKSTEAEIIGKMSPPWNKQRPHSHSAGARRGLLKGFFRALGGRSE